MHTIHTIPPVYDENSRILVLGSFPSVKSRDEGFFYGHPQNRFWKLLAALFSSEPPKTVEEKKKLLLSNNIALWDVISSCDITGSSDSSIKNVIPNDLTPILSNGKVGAVFTNGRTASALYRKYLRDKTGIMDMPLPSTSPANASFSFEKLLENWRTIKNYL